MEKTSLTEKDCIMKVGYLSRTQYSFLKLFVEMKANNNGGYSTTKGANDFTTLTHYQVIIDFICCKMQ